MKRHSSCKPALIELKEIDQNDKTCRISFRPVEERLILSIQQLGILTPLRVQQISGKPFFRIVSGWQRYAVAQKLRIDYLPVEIFTSDIDLFFLFRLQLFDNLALHPFNLIEKSLVLQRLHQRFHIEKAQIIKDYFPVLELGQNERVWELIYPLASYAEEVKHAIAQDILSIDVLEKLATLTAEDRLELTNWIRRLKWGKNRQRELIGWLVDLIRLTNKSIGEIFQQPEIQKIVTDSQMPIPLQANRVLSVLRQWRYPRLTQTEQRFAELCRELHLSPNIRLFPPPFFEGDSFRVEFTFRNIEEFKSNVQRLQAAIENPALAELQDLI